MGEIDAAYRRLFQHGQVLQALCACVLPPSLLAALDWGGMRPLPTGHVSDRLQQRVGDCAWLIPRRRCAPGSAGLAGVSVAPETIAAVPAGTDAVVRPFDGLCVLLLLELQAAPDVTMPLRMLTYTGLTWQALLNGDQVHLPLPPVLPIVFYSGARRWRASRELSALVGTASADLQAYQPQMRYLLVEERALLADARLPDENLFTLLLRLGAGAGIEQWRTLLHTLRRVTEGPGFAELDRAFAAWLRYVVQRAAGLDEALPQAGTLQEFEMMISEKPGIWARQWEKEGRAKGRVEGRVEGRMEGQAELLLRQLARRFGDPSDEIIRCVRAAGSAQLEAWSLAILDASSLEDVFRQ